MYISFKLDVLMIFLSFLFCSDSSLRKICFKTKRRKEHDNEEWVSARSKHHWLLTLFEHAFLRKKELPHWKTEFSVMASKKNRVWKLKMRRPSTSHLPLLNRSNRRGVHKESLGFVGIEVWWDAPASSLTLFIVSNYSLPSTLPRSHPLCPHPTFTSSPL